MIAIGDGLLLRRGDRALVVEDLSRAAQVRAVLDWLAGEGNRLAFADLAPALQIIDELAAAGLLVDRAAAEPLCVMPHRPTSHLFAGANAARVVVVGEGPAARAAIDTLASQGMTVADGDDGDEERADLVVACPPGPDLSRLEAMNRAAVAGGTPVLPAFLLGDLAIVGPVGAASGWACLRCWELR